MPGEGRAGRRAGEGSPGGGTKARRRGEEVMEEGRGAGWRGRRGVRGASPPGTPPAAGAEAGPGGRVRGGGLRAR